jgi:hypothetical protein
MEPEIAQLDAIDESDLTTDETDEIVASKKKGDDEDGIIAVLIG